MLLLTHSRSFSKKEVKKIIRVCKKRYKKTKPCLVSFFDIEGAEEVIKGNMYGANAHFSVIYGLQFDNMNINNCGLRGYSAPRMAMYFVVNPLYQNINMSGHTAAREIGWIEEFSKRTAGNKGVRRAVSISAGGDPVSKYLFKMTEKEVHKDALNKIQNYFAKVRTPLLFTDARPIKEVLVAPPGRELYINYKIYPSWNLLLTVKDRMVKAGFTIYEMPAYINSNHTSRISNLDKPNLDNGDKTINTMWLCMPPHVTMVSEEARIIGGKSKVTKEMKDKWENINKNL